MKDSRQKRGEITSDTENVLDASNFDSLMLNLDKDELEGKLQEDDYNEDRAFS